MTLSNVQEPPLEGAEESISVLELLLNGGYMMIPILILWMVSIYIFVERQRTLGAASKTPESFKDQIRSLVISGDINGAMMICNKTETPVARMIEKGISRIGNFAFMRMLPQANTCDTM